MQAEESETHSVSAAEMKRCWRVQQEDVEFPDEVPNQKMCCLPA